MFVFVTKTLKCVFLVGSWSIGREPFQKIKYSMKTTFILYVVVVMHDGKILTKSKNMQQVLYQYYLQYLQPRPRL